MYFLLALVVTGIISYFLPVILWNSSWSEIIKVLKGEYENDLIGSLNIIQKYGAQSDYTQFFKEKLTTLIVLSVAIFIVMLIICAIIKKAVNKK